ncbi:hypothetical protein [Actinoplanes rectilineatus]|uniref:hypothetical protein n=1 Tax=Actinoplanes rectilineatus TaxID=113571 RepID=UPI0012FC48F3|nr:hypothetical protein [Actinoplanes rectilineatus]
MLTSIVFCVKAMQLWQRATGESPRLLADSWIASGATVPHVAEIVLSAHDGNLEAPLIPGHPDDQKKATMNLGPVTALTLCLAAEHRPYPLVSVLQDLLIDVQREPAGDFGSVGGEDED